MYQQIKPPQLRRSLSPTRLLLHLLLSLIIIVILPSLPPSSAVDYNTELYAACNKSTPFKCGEWEYSIQYPFLYTSDRPDYCGRPGYNLTCVRDSVPVLQAADKQYQVLGLDYSNRVLTLLDLTFSGGGPCSSSTPPLTNTSLDPALFNTDHEHVVDMTVINCTLTVTSLANAFKMCSSVSDGYQLYYSTADSVKFGQSCEIASIKITNDTELWPFSSSDILEVVTNGFNATWTAGSRSPCDEGCAQRNGICIYDDSSKSEKCMCSHGPCNGTGKRHTKAIAIGIAIASAFLLICAALLFYIQRRILHDHIIVFHSESNNMQRIETLLEENGYISPVRYKYSDLKRITKSFREKLGHGGYGTVFKGNLQDGRLVAVKLLNSSKGDGEEFINEVASIGRTSHVNVVRLLGFCLQGHKRALVYEFMSNGSLDKFICSEEQRMRIGWKRLHDIAVSIARGLEYLHRGCNTRIVHFDIKPHNILLDDEFCPKISDFGLAKLCSPKDSIISMLDARGTAGYIAPEVFCRNFGAVSTKSDVYSYGMMVLEMTGATTKPTSVHDNSSEPYFPQWVYKELEHDGDLQGLGENSEFAKKLILVGLWCIQTMPANRPSIRRVIEMLEGKIDDIEHPPLPSYLSPPLLSVLNSSS